jgi:hypothetical protein
MFAMEGLSHRKDQPSVSLKPSMRQWVIFTNDCRTLMVWLQRTSTLSLVISRDFVAHLKP